MTKQKPWSAHNNNDWWAVKSPKGYMCPTLFADTRTTAIENFIENGALFVSWPCAVSAGYRAVKIRIVEME